MIQLYASLSPNVIKVYLMLEELELPYEQHLVDVWKGGQFEPAFLALNPNAKVPVIVDPDGPEGRPVTIFESGAILMYLAEKCGNRFLPADGMARWEVLKWTMIQMTGVGPMFGQMVHFGRYAPAGNDYAVKRYTGEARRLLDLLEGRLGEVTYLGGDDYSIADIATFPWIRALGRVFPEEPAFAQIPAGDFPNLRRWIGAIGERPAVGRTFARLASVPSSAAQATPDDMDRFFHRGAYARA